MEGSNGAGGTRVVIRYDLATDIEPCTVTALLSKDGGMTYDYPITSVTGHVGGGITSDTNHAIYWDIAADYPDEDIPAKLRARWDEL